MSIDTDWEYKASHWERESKRLIVEINNLKNEILLLEGKLSPFKPGGDWGYIKALIVAGAPDPVIGKNLAKKITEAQAAIDGRTFGIASSVPKTGTIVPVARVDIDDILHDLDEARGFAAMSPAGRDNIDFAIANLPDRFEQMYRIGFGDGENHAQECTAVETQRVQVLQDEKRDLIKTLERIASLVESRATIIDTLTKALETIVKGETTVFDDDLQCDVHAWMDEQEMREVARSALSASHSTSREGER